MKDNNYYRNQLKLDTKDNISCTIIHLIKDIQTSHSRVLPGKEENDSPIRSGRIEQPHVGRAAARPRYLQASPHKHKVGQKIP